MPTYDYICSICGKELEIFQNISDEKVKICSTCGNESMVRMPGKGSSIIFKGTGFYCNDSKGKNESVI